jgi:hypothetical protein
MLTDEDRKEIRKIVRDDILHAFSVVNAAVGKSNYPPEYKKAASIIFNEILRKLPPYTLDREGGIPIGG